MTRTLLWVLPAALLVALVVGESLPPVPAVLLVAVIAVVASAGLWSQQARRVGEVTGRLTDWANPPRRAITVQGAGPWRALSSAMNVLARDLDAAQAAAIDRSEWLRGLAAALSQPAFVLSLPDLRVAIANDAATAFFSLPPDVSDASLIASVGSADVVAACREAVHTGERVVVDVTLQRREVTAVAAAVDLGVLLVLTDRSDVARVEQIRRDFVASASHELKTPVAGIQALADALGSIVDDERAAGVLARLRAESDRLSALVRDLLDLRQLEDPELSRHAPLDLSALTRGVVDDLDALASDQGVVLVAHLDGTATVAGDARALELAVSNLVRNAIQYTDAGGRVEVRVVPGEGEHLLEVVDDGIGIPRSQLPRIFERFYRVDDARSRATGGTGLGLSIVRHAVEAHGGRVEVDSLIHHGTTFRVTLPLEHHAA